LQKHKLKKKEHQSDALWRVQEGSTEAQVHEHNCIGGGGRARAANFHIAHSSVLALVFVIFQAGMAYSNLDLTKVKHKIINYQ
jgi:hypothetical protein